MVNFCLYLIAVLPQMNLLCKSGYTNEDGQCDTPKRKSLNKGKHCLQDRDCKTDVPGSVARCRCGINPWGIKVCDITEGDDEWINALKKVSSLLIHSSKNTFI